MLTRILKTIKKYGMISAGDRVLCALSGGVDSSVLLDVLVKCSEELRISVCAAHLNHMLRGEEAMRDEKFVREKCLEYGIPLMCERAEIAKLAKETGQSTELCARNVRYDFLRRAKEQFGACKISTAHNANDSAETVIFNMARGGGLDALCGIPPVRGDIIRPLIEIPREDIEAYAEAHGVSFCEDRTNAETVYSRNRIRHKVIPEMLKINSAAIRNAARSAEVLREESELLKELAENEMKKIADSEYSCKCKKLLGVPKALFARVCEIFAANAMGAGEYTLWYRHVSDIRSLCESSCPSATIDLPLGLRVRREYENIVFEKAEDMSAPLPVKLSEGEFSFGKYAVYVRKMENRGKINNSVNTFYLPYDKIQDNLVVRPRQIGDEIKLLKRPVKSIKKLFIDSRIPKNEREYIPLIADGEKVLAVFGFGQDERYLPTENEDIIEIAIRCGEIEE